MQNDSAPSQASLNPAEFTQPSGGAHVDTPEGHPAAVVNNSPRTAAGPNAPQGLPQRTPAMQNEGGASGKARQTDAVKDRKEGKPKSKGKGSIVVLSMMIGLLIAALGVAILFYFNGGSFNFEIKFNTSNAPSTPAAVDEPDDRPDDAQDMTQSTVASTTPVEPEDAGDSQEVTPETTPPSIASSNTGNGALPYGMTAFDPKDYVGAWTIGAPCTDLVSNPIDEEQWKSIDVLFLTPTDGYEIQFGCHYARSDFTFSSNAVIDGNVATFSIIDNGERLEGVLTFDHASVKLTITDSTVMEVPTGTIITYDSFVSYHDHTTWAWQYYDLENNTP